MAEGAQVWEDPKNGIIVRCEASPKAVAMLRFFADSMEDFLKEKKAKADAALAAKPWDDLITEGWAAPSASEAECTCGPDAMNPYCRVHWPSRPEGGGR